MKHSQSLCALLMLNALSAVNGAAIPDIQARDALTKTDQQILTVSPNPLTTTSIVNPFGLIEHVGVTADTMGENIHRRETSAVKFFANSTLAQQPQGCDPTTPPPAAAAAAATSSKPVQLAQQSEEAPVSVKTIVITEECDDDASVTPKTFAASNATPAASGDDAAAAPPPASSAPAPSDPTGTVSMPTLSKPNQSSLPSATGDTKYYDNGPIMKAIATDEVSDVFPRKEIPLELPEGVEADGPIHTNKFYANMFLDGQNLQNYAQPYVTWWSNLTGYSGMAVSHSTFSERTYGPDANADPVKFYINPVGIMSLVFSAEGMSAESMKLSTSEIDTFSVSATISSGNGNITMPMAQGMGMVTAEYTGLKPQLNSQVTFESFDKADSSDLADGMTKYVAKLGNEATWGVYVTGDVELKLQNATTVVGDKVADNAVIQVGVIPDGGDKVIDECAGMYVTDASVDASVQDGLGVYTISYNTKGESKSQKPLLWALPHHVESFTKEMQDSATDVTIDSTTKGVMTGYQTTNLTMAETLHTSLQWLPWTENNTEPKWGNEVIEAMKKSAHSDLSQDIEGQINIASTYTAGKAFDKYAYVALVASDILKDDNLTQFGLSELKKNFKIYTENKQPFQLMYDTKFKGVTSSAGQDGDPMQDYGAPYYNDHHFHYGYYIHTAAVIGYLDKKQGGNWAEENKEWVNALVRDVANPSKDDTHLPVWRNFDWWNGHSWASGMFSSAGGKNEESTSEDVNFAYAMKLWGQVSGDKAMEARGDLMLAVLRRSLDAYFYLKDDNKNQPKNFIKNKVAGITFENQLDHTTYFGNNIEYIQGIHMLPVTPASGLTRSAEFVQQEWEQKLEPVLDNVDGGWIGILRVNQAIFDGAASYKYFSSGDFDQQKLDGGASLTWYLAYSSGMQSLQQ